jgi:hypothetical protein
VTLSLLPIIDFQTAHGPAARPTAQPFGMAHGRHGTACSVPVPAQPEGQCNAWAADLAHDMARARHGQGSGTVAGTAARPAPSRPNGSFSCCPLAQPTLPTLHIKPQRPPQSANPNPKSLPHHATAARNSLYLSRSCLISDLIRRHCSP